MKRVKIFSVVVMAAGAVAFLLSCLVRIPDLALLASILSVGMFASGVALFQVSSQLTEIASASGRPIARP